MEAEGLRYSGSEGERAVDTVWNAGGAAKITHEECRREVIRSLAEGMVVE